MFNVLNINKNTFLKIFILIFGFYLLTFFLNVVNAQSSNITECNREQVCQNGQCLGQGTYTCQCGEGYVASCQYFAWEWLTCDLMPNGPTNLCRAQEECYCNQITYVCTENGQIFYPNESTSCTLTSQPNSCGLTQECPGTKTCQSNGLGSEWSACTGTCNPPSNDLCPSPLTPPPSTSSISPSPSTQFPINSPSLPPSAPPSSSSSLPPPPSSIPPSTQSPSTPSPSSNNLITEIKANNHLNAISISKGDSANVSWNSYLSDGSRNADNCSIRENGLLTNWSGSSGNRTVNNIVSNKRYDLSCYITLQNNTLYGNSSVDINVLEASLSSVPNFGQSPLRTSLIATLSGTSNGTARYFFDCNNDGINELDTGDVSPTFSFLGVPIYNYTASNLCYYSNPGIYTAKVEAWHNFGRVIATTTITVSSSSNPVNTNTSTPSTGPSFTPSQQPSLSPSSDLIFFANPSSINFGNSSTLSWFGNNINNCIASGGWQGNKPTSGSEVIKPATTTVYTLECEDINKNKIIRSVRIEVNQLKPKIQEIIPYFNPPSINQFLKQIANIFLIFNN